LITKNGVKTKLEKSKNRFHQYRCCFWSILLSFRAHKETFP